MSADLNRSRRVAVTGLGVVSPCGIGVDAMWAALRNGQSGISLTESFDCSVVTRGIGGEIKDFNDESIKKVHLKEIRKSLKVMSRDIQMAMAAASLAIAHAGLKEGALEPERIGVEFGSNLIFSPPVDLQDACWACTDAGQHFHFDLWGETGYGKMEPLWMLKYLPNMPACHIAIYADARGPSNSLTLDEASSNLVLTEALRILRRGAADAVIAGSTGTRLHPIRAMHARMWDPLGTDDADPGKSCRPFDAHRQGQVIAEGAGCVILEDEVSAGQRGAVIHGYLLGGGSSCVLGADGRPNLRQALVNAMQSALEDAGLEPGDIGHINAHGSGAIDDDAVEAEAIREVFGDAPQVPVAGLKGYFGNSGAACGAIEFIASLRAAAEGLAPRTLNCDHPDPALGLNVTQDFVPVASRTFLKLSFTRSGQASAVVGAGRAPG